MTGVLVFVLSALAVVVAVHVLADRTGLPAAALLTVTGLVYSVLPGPGVALPPQVILTFVIPPLLYSAAVGSSMVAIRRNLRAVMSLSVALVFATALAVGVGVHLLVPSVGLAAGIALGAAVAPPDPVAALAIGRRVGLPEKIITLIEGEGLLNDATALTIFSVAAVAASSGSFSLGHAALRFLLASVGGLVAGAVVAGIVRLLRTYIREPILVNAISLATPFAAYLLGEELRASGVLAVVVAGLAIAHETPRLTSGSSRLQTSAVWRLVDFVLEGFVFLLLGVQLPSVVAGLSSYPRPTIWLAAGGCVAIVLVLRPLWLVASQSLPRQLHLRLGGSDPHEEVRLRSRDVLVLSWAGTRGVISLAAIFTLPRLTQAGTPFPARDLLLFCTYVVVLVTLVGQGLTFAPFVRAIGVRANAADAARLRNEARLAAVQAGLARLEQLAEDEDINPNALQAMRDLLSHRQERFRGRLELLDSSEDGELPVSPEQDAVLRARRDVIGAQREELLRWRDEGRLPDVSLRLLERELDHEENTIPRAAT